MSRHVATSQGGAPAGARLRPREWRLLHVVVGGVVAASLVAGVVLIVKAVNGDFSGNYSLVGMFSRAGEGIHAGSGVSYRGVRVGSVSSITLADHEARLTLSIDRGFRIPADAVATIRPKNLFGAESVSLAFGSTSHGPWLQPGDRLRHTAVSDQVTQLFAALDPLLEKIDAPALGSVISDLSRASSGEGPNIAASIREGTKLASLFDATIAEQISALGSFSAFNSAIAPIGPSVNSISASSNQGLPVFNEAAARFQHFLDAVAPFAQRLATFLQDFRPDIVTLLVQGANVARVLLARRQDLGQVVSGLYNYVQAIAKGAGPETLPGGTKMAYYNTFVMFSQVNNLICSLIAPAEPGLAYLAPLQQAVSGAGSPLDCASQIAAFDAAQAGASKAPSPALPAARVSSPATAAVPAGPTGAPSNAAEKLLNSLYAEIGAPSVPARKSVESYLKMLMGGGAVQ